MSTQSKAKKETYLSLLKNPLNFGLPEMYGVPEFTYYDATNIYNWPKINKLLTTIIMHYEPRLHNVVVSIKEFSKQKQSLVTQILAKIIMPIYMEEVTFLLETSLNDFE
jgi:type VI secretion system protein ImpF